MHSVFEMHISIKNSVAYSVCTLRSWRKYWRNMLYDMRIMIGKHDEIEFTDSILLGKTCIKMMSIVSKWRV